MPGQMDRPPTPRQQAQRLQQQIDELQAEHDTLLKELQAIHALATKEEATQTAGRVQKLIAQRQEAFGKELERLKMRRQRIQSFTLQRTEPMDRPHGATKQAPEAQLTSFGGHSFNLSDYKDKIVVLEWFNSECPFSRYHHETKQTMADLARKYKDKGVVWFAVNSTNHTTPEANVAFAKKHEVPYPILDDRSGAVGHAFGARTTPHVFVIDRGAIVYDGAIDNAPMGKVQGGSEPVNYVDQVLARLTSGQKVEPESKRPYGCSVKYKK